PFTGPWDPPGHVGLMRDTYDTWLNLSKEEMDKRKGGIVVIGYRPEMLAELYAAAKDGPLLLEYRAPFENASEEIAAKRPEVLVLDLLHPEHEELGMDRVIESISAIKTVPDYKPFVLVFNCGSKSEAVEKALGFKGIFVSAAVL